MVVLPVRAARRKRVKRRQRGAILQQSQGPNDKKTLFTKRQLATNWYLLKMKLKPLLADKSPAPLLRVE